MGEAVSTEKFLSELMDRLYENRRKLEAQKELLDRNLNAITDEDGAIKKQYISAYDRAEKAYKQKEDEYEHLYSLFEWTFNRYAFAVGMGNLYFDRGGKAYQGYLDDFRDILKEEWASIIHAKKNLNIIDLNRALANVSALFTERHRDDYRGYVKDLMAKPGTRVISRIIKESSCLWDAAAFVKAEADGTLDSLMPADVFYEYVEFPDFIVENYFADRGLCMKEENLTADTISDICDYAGKKNIAYTRLKKLCNACVMEKKGEKL